MLLTPNVDRNADILFHWLWPEVGSIWALGRTSAGSGDCGGGGGNFHISNELAKGGGDGDGEKCYGLSPYWALVTRLDFTGTIDRRNKQGKTASADLRLVHMQNKPMQCL